MQGQNTVTPEPKWENIVKILLRNRRHLADLLTDDSLRIRMQFFCLHVIFFTVSALMSVLNVITSWHILTVLTVVFAIMNLGNIVLMLLSWKTEMLSRVLFAIEILALFTAFLIFGEPEGFSAVWIALLPACGLLLYRLKYGILVSSTEFLLLVFLLWTKTGNSLLMYPYTDSFKMRFPLLYVAFFMVGILFEFIRNKTQQELTEARHDFEMLSKHDPLTGLLNRLGFTTAIEEAAPRFAGQKRAMALIDFDRFKQVNDTYGHEFGDTVLKDISAIVREVSEGCGFPCRWGGDELSVYFYNADRAEELCREMNRRAGEHRFLVNGEEFRETISIGLAVAEAGAPCDLAELIRAADAYLYHCKTNGKNHVEAGDYADCPEQ